MSVAKMPLPGERNGLVSTESWMARLDAERKEHDAQRRELQARNTELVEQRRALAQKLDEARANLLHAEKIVNALQKDPQRDCYTLSRLWVLAQDPLTRRYFETLL
jgi:septal ring factor EnvC (AmiA/AmiB activator)